MIAILVIRNQAAGVSRGRTTITVNGQSAWRSRISARKTMALGRQMVSGTVLVVKWSPDEVVAMRITYFYRFIPLARSGELGDSNQIPVTYDTKDLTR